jgi:hypothetical protein
MAKKEKKEEEIKEPTEKNHNMDLWYQVCETNPELTRVVTTRGKFTSICAQSQRKRATEIWGSYGINWGLKNLTWDYLRDENNKVVLLYLWADFHYPDPGGFEHSFEIASDIRCRTKDGGYVEDCHKKLQTDLITKALSMLGFNSDVFEGKFDDDKYVAEMREKFKSPAKDMLDKDKQMNGEDKRRMQDLHAKLEILGEEAGKKVSKKKLLDRVIEQGGYPINDAEIDKLVKLLKNQDIYTGE